MKQEINLDPLKIILDKLKISNKNIYLGLDFLLIVKQLNPKKINYIKTTELILDYFLKVIGKSGNLIIPVFYKDCIPKKKFNIINSPGQSGVFGNILLSKYFFLRTSHPLYSFLCFGNKFKEYKKINDLHATGKKSLWKNFIEDEYDLITLGHHYSRSITHVHYTENLLNVDYRFNKKFSITYTNKKNISSRKIFSFFARKKEVCDFSGITKECDKVFYKKNITSFCRYKNIVSFKMNIKEASNLFYDDLKKNSERLVSYVRSNKPNKNVLCATDGSISNLERHYLNIK